MSIRNEDTFLFHIKSSSPPRLNCDILNPIQQKFKTQKHSKEQKLYTRCGAARPTAPRSMFEQNSNLEFKSECKFTFEHFWINAFWNKWRKEDMIEPKSVAAVLKVVSVSRFTPGMSSLQVFFLLEFLSPFSGINDPSSFTVVSPQKQFLPTLQWGHLKMYPLVCDAQYQAKRTLLIPYRWGSRCSNATSSCNILLLFKNGFLNSVPAPWVFSLTNRQCKKKKRPQTHSVSHCTRNYLQTLDESGTLLLLCTAGGGGGGGGGAAAAWMGWFEGSAPLFPHRLRIGPSPDSLCPEHASLKWEAR